MKKLSRFPEKRTAGAVRFSTRGGSPNESLLTRPASIPPGMPPSAPAPCPVIASFSCPPPKKPCFFGDPSFHWKGQAKPVPSKVLRSAQDACTALPRWPALPAEGKITRPASIPPGMPPSAPAPCPATASFSCPPPKKPCFFGDPSFHWKGQAKPVPSKVLRSAQDACTALPRWPALPAEGKITRPASIPPGMPPSAPAPCPVTASFSCPLFAFPAASSFSSRRRRSTSPARPCAWP